MTTTLVEVPGKFNDDEVAYLDLETVKVPCNWVSPKGEYLGRRWSVFMAGVANNGIVSIVERDYALTENDLLIEVDEAIGLAPRVVYRATRKFDEMILKGRYTYARRGPAPEPFYPSLPDAEELVWDCRRPEPHGYWESIRERELMSRDIYDAWKHGCEDVNDMSRLVLIHNLRDVVELIGAYGDPDEECAEWCRRVLTDREFAWCQIDEEGE